MKVFISSVYRDSVISGEERRLQVRKRLQRLGLSDKVELFLPEYPESELEEMGWRAIVDTCVHALHGSDLIIVLLFRRWGTAIEVDDLGPAPVSYLEVELFHASLRRVPVLFFQAEDFEPEPELASLIRLVQRITPAAHWVKAPQALIEAEVVELLRRIDKSGALPAGLSRFCDALSDNVSFQQVDREIASTELSFMKGFAPAHRAPASLARADLLLAEARHLSGKGEGTFVDRLSRLWLALRELAKRPLGRGDDDLARRWIELCELWNNSAAWLRLHGPMHLSVLASLQTRTQLRDAGYLSEQMFPYGPFASEAYSIAKASDTRRWQRNRFETARRLASKQIAKQGTDQSGAFGIRASATMQLAQRGRPWLVPFGLLDYRRMLQVRQRLDSSRSEIGEALVELGYAEFALGKRLPWTRNFALDRMREGVALLDHDHTAGRAGFAIRAKKKLAESLERSRCAEEADQQRREIGELQKLHGLPRD
jgi:hypothetical protein